MTKPTTSKFNVGDKIIDRGGFRGSIIEVTEWEGSRWYDVRFSRGEAVRYDEDLVAAQ